MKKPITLSTRMYTDDYMDRPELKKQRLAELSATMRTLEEQTSAIDTIIRDTDPCPPAMFKDAAFLDVEKKRKVFARWEAFVKHGFGNHLFSDSVYDHLQLHCGFIAHYNRQGFYATYWYDYGKEHPVTRPIPGVFPQWKSFMDNFSYGFRLHGEYSDLSLAMMHRLKKELLTLRKDLENEVIEIYQHDCARSWPLYQAEWQRISQEIDAKRKEIVELTTRLDDMDIDSFIAELRNEFVLSFPDISTDSWEVTVKEAGNLF